MIILGAGPWGGGGGYTVTKAINHSVNDQTGLSFDIDIMGPDIFVEAAFEGTPNNYAVIYSTAQEPIAHAGIGFRTLRVTVPDGGATASLLGLGLAGLAFLRRKV